MSGRTAKYAVIKTKEFSFLNGEKHFGTTIVNVFFKDKWSGCAHISDDLIKDPVLVEEGGKLRITGKKINFFWSTGKTSYGKRYELFNEITESGKKLTPADVVQLILYHSAQTLKVEECEIKLGYSNFWDWIRRKRMYYIDCTREVISKLGHIEPEYIKQNKKSLYVEGWHKSTLVSDYDFQTNSYSISNHD